MAQMPREPGAEGSPVVIVDDDEATRDSLCALLEVMGHPAVAFASGAALMAAGVPPGAACLLVDVRLAQGEDGIALVERLRRAGNRTPVVIVTGHGDIPMAVRAMRAGAVDFVEKPYSTERLLGAVAEARSAGARAAGAAALIAALTPREREVLVGLVDGKANKAVAFELGISVRTVEAYRATIMEKLPVRSFAEVVRLAMAAGLVGEPE
jgi:two-component system response regulator FixJ